MNRGIVAPPLLLAVATTACLAAQLDAPPSQPLLFWLATGASPVTLPGGCVLLAPPAKIVSALASVTNAFGTARAKLALPRQANLIAASLAAQAASSAGGGLALSDVLQIHVGQ
jgi:hypothetical protein